MNTLLLGAHSVVPGRRQAVGKVDTLLNETGRVSYYQALIESASWGRRVCGWQGQRNQDDKGATQIVAKDSVHHHTNM